MILFLAILTIEQDLDDVIQLDARLGKGLSERLGLGEIAGKAVEQPAALAVRFLEAVEDHRDGDRIGDQFAAVDEPFGFLAEFRSLS